MRFKTIDLLVPAAILATIVYFAVSRDGYTGFHLALLKGVGVALLALWAAIRAPASTDKWLIVAVLLLGALGDVLIEGPGNLTRGAVAFLAGHIVAVVLYWRNRQGSPWLAIAIALGVSLTAFSLPDDRAAAPGIALYALGLGAMAGMALISRFSRSFVGLGAASFVISDLLIFARMGPLHGSMLPGMLIWPTYVAAQALIAWGVVSGLVRRTSR